MAPEIETGISRQEVKSACDYLLSLATHGYVCILPEQNIKISFDPDANKIKIALKRAWSNPIATFGITDIQSLNPVVAIKRPFADQDLEIFGTHLPKVHPTEIVDSEPEIRIKGHEAQELLVNLAQALKGKDAKFIPLAPRN